MRRASAWCTSSRPMARSKPSGSGAAGRIVPIPWAPVVFGPERQRGSMKLLDLSAARGPERDVGRYDRRLFADPEIGVRAIVEAGGASVLHVVLVAKGRQKSYIKGF